MPSTESPRVVWERALRCMESFDVEGYASCFAADGVQCFPFAPSFMPTKLVGRNQIRQQLSAYRAKSKESGRRTVAIVTTAVHEMADCEGLIAEFEVHGIENGAAFVIPYVHVVRVRDGQIVSLRDYFDSLALAERIRQSHGSS